MHTVNIASTCGPIGGCAGIWTVLCAVAILSNTVRANRELRCDRYYTGEPSSGVLAHQNFPFNYTELVNCRHRFFVPYVRTLDNVRLICFTFLRFRLVDSQNCVDDYLMFGNSVKYCDTGHAVEVDRSDLRSTVFSSQFCWSLLPWKVFDVTFNSIYNSNEFGFYAHYTIADYSLSEVPSSESNISSNNSQIQKGGPCETTQFRCFDGECLGLSRVCDGVKDCEDGSDETYAHASCPGNESQNIDACSFEQSDCQLKTSGWFLINLNSRPPDLGPRGANSDHTYQEFGKGHYLNADVTVASVAYANYTWPATSASSRYEDRCLSFYHYMKGVVGSLTVNIRNKNGWTAAWSRQGSQAWAWLQGEINIPATMFPLYEVSFKVVHDPKAVNNIGLDDISLLPGRCFGDDISCTFEVDFCSWRPHLSTLGVWTRHNGSTPTPHTGPTTERSDRNGYYVYMEASDLSAGGAVRLVSAPVSVGQSGGGGARCLQFWYHMHGLGAGVLRVFIARYDAIVLNLWEQRGDQRDMWIRETITISDITGPYRIIFEGVRGSSELSDIALDDIQLTPGFCETSGGPWNPIDPSIIVDSSRPRTLPTMPPPPPSRWEPKHCRPGEQLCRPTGWCYQSTRICDGQLDCTDYSDELNCGGGVIYPPDGYHQYRRSSVIGAAVGGFLVVVVVVSSIVLAVKRRQIAACIRRRRCARTRSCGVLHNDPAHFARYGGEPPPYNCPPPTAPLYMAEPPPYSEREADKVDAAPPEYELEDMLSVALHKELRVGGRGEEEEETNC